MRGVACLCAVGLSAGAAWAGWPGDPGLNLAVATGPGEQAVVKVAAAPDGSTYVGWFDNRGGSYAVYLQRLDARGSVLWADGGLLISDNPQSTSLVDWDLRADSEGNAILAFTDTRDGGDLDVFAYRVSPAGEQLWGEDGVQVSANGNFDADPRIVQNALGDFVVVWPRLGTPGPGLVLQLISPAGEKRYAGDGLVIAGDGTQAPAFAEMEASEGGDVVVSWLLDTRAFASPRRVRMQRFTPGGEGVWNGGAPVEVSGTAVVPIAHRPRLVGDGSGGGVVFWHDTRTGNFQVYVQRVTGAGVVRFAAGGARATTNASELHLDPAAVFDPANQRTLVFWNSRNGSQSQWGLRAQSLDESGLPVWDPAGRVLEPVSGTNRSFQRAVRAGDGMIVLWLETPAGTGQDRLLARRLDALGNDVWSPAVREVSSRPSDKFRTAVAAGPDGEVRAAWEEGSDIYAQNLNTDGTIGLACPGDWNRDGVIDFNDLLEFLNAYNASSRGADVNGDGVVDFNDLLEYLNLYNAAC